MRFRPFSFKSSLQIILFRIIGSWPSHFRLLLFLFFLILLFIFFLFWLLSRLWCFLFSFFLLLSSTCIHFHLLFGTLILFLFCILFLLLLFLKLLPLLLQFWTKWVDACFSTINVLSRIDFLSFPIEFFEDVLKVHFFSCLSMQKVLKVLFLFFCVLFLSLIEIFLVFLFLFLPNCSLLSHKLLFFLSDSLLTSEEVFKLLPMLVIVTFILVRLLSEWKHELIHLSLMSHSVPLLFGGYIVWSFDDWVQSLDFIRHNKYINLWLKSSNEYLLKSNLQLLLAWSLLVHLDIQKYYNASNIVYYIVFLRFPL